MTLTGDNKTILVSADSHVTESPAIWDGILDRSFWGDTSNQTTRGTDPELRGGEMQQDGVTAEVLYPSLGLRLFGIEDVETQEAACHAYNEWIGEYCKADPDRLISIGLIPCYRPEVAVREVEFCHGAGMRGVMVWQTPHPDLPFTSSHYDEIWREIEARRLPLNVHILTGFNYSARRAPGAATMTARDRSIEAFHGSINDKLACSADTLFGFIFSGVLERFPQLKLVIVENEMGWLPYMIDQWDYYYRRHREARPLENVSSLPSEFFSRQVYATFFRDPWVGVFLANQWGVKNLMWSSDFPHPNSSWPNSRQYVQSTLGALNGDVFDRVVRRNCVELYGFDEQKLVDFD